MMEAHSDICYTRVPTQMKNKFHDFSRVLIFKLKFYNLPSSLCDTTSREHVAK